MKAPKYKTKFEHFLNLRNITFIYFYFCFFLELRSFKYVPAWHDGAFRDTKKALVLAILIMYVTEITG